MTFGYLPLFVGLLAVLLGCSAWAGFRRWVSDSLTRRQRRANERWYEEHGR